MKFLLASVISGLILAQPALAAPDCGTWSPDALTLVAWEATSDERQNITITLTLQSNLAADIAMVGAQARFFDALGRHVDTISIDPDLHLAAGGAAVTNARTRTQRLVKVEPADLVVLVCTKSVIFEDGTAEEFAR